MLCNSCNLKMICKTYDNIRNILHAQIAIDKCDFYSKYELNLNAENNKTNNTNNNINRDIEKDSLIALRQKRLFSLENNDKIENKQDKKETTYIECPTCGGVTTEDDIKLCDICNKRVCSSCGTFFNGKILCDKCFGYNENTSSEKTEREIDKLDDDATEAQINSAKIKDKLFENNEIQKENANYKIPKVTKKNKTERKEK